MNLEKDNEKEKDIVKDVHSSLLKMFVDGGLLARHIGLAQYQNKKIYPVVIGGVNVLRCARMSKRAIEMLGSVYKNDLDIKFVINKIIKNNEDNTVRTADKMRREMLAAIMADTEIHRRIQRLGERNGVDIVLKVEDMTQTRNEMLMRNLMVNIYVEYKIEGRLVERKEFIDTGIYSNYSQELFKSYQKFFKQPLRKPIPVRVHEGVPFATCGWTYYDTIRMLILYGQRLNAAEVGSRDQRFYFLRYLKYLAKFAVLYVQMNKIAAADDDKFRKIKGLYMAAKTVLAASDIKDKSIVGVPRDHQDVMRDLFDVLKAQTNLTKLQDVIEKGSRVFTLKDT